MNIAIIAAVAENNAIGLNNKMPWHLPEDLQYFKKVTMGKSVIMGRKTYESIGFPLPGRHNIVISRTNHSQLEEGVDYAASIDSAVKIAQTSTRSVKKDEIMIVGGAELYRQFLPEASRLYLTMVHETFEADTFFPEFDLNVWHEAERHEPANSKISTLKYTFIVYERS